MEACGHDRRVSLLFLKTMNTTIMSLPDYKSSDYTFLVTLKPTTYYRHTPKSQIIRLAEDYLPATDVI